jgi:hypothetical protein
MKKSEKEILWIKKQNVFIINKLILQGQVPLNEISQQFTGIMHLNNLNTYVWEWLSPEITNRFNIDVEEERKLTLEQFALNHIHPVSIKELAPKFFQVLKTKNDMPFETIEYVKLNDKTDYAWVHRTCVFSFELGNIVSLSHFIKGSDYELGKDEKLWGEYDFIRTNYDKFIRLTNRQKHILKLLALGYTNDAIAAELQISSNTVRTHRNDIHRILDLRWKNVNHSQIYIRYAFHFGLM